MEKKFNTPSGKPPMHFIQCKSKSDARERARDAGLGKKRQLCYSNIT
jgi:hypothetical protein